MIKGLIALFTSGVIFNPLVLLGVISGIYSIIHCIVDMACSLLIAGFLTPVLSEKTLFVAIFF